MKCADILFCYTPFFTLVLVAASEDATTLNAVTLSESVVDLRSKAEQELRMAEQSATALHGARAAHFAGRFAIAWADEYLMTREWSGRRYWMSHPLQGDWAEGRRAGDSFFQDLQALVPSSADDAAAARIALRCLSLGFVGRYYGQLEALTILHEETVKRFSLKTRVYPFPLALEHIPSRMKACWHVAWLLLVFVAGFWFMQNHTLSERGQAVLSSAVEDQHPKEKTVSFWRYLNIQPGGAL